MPIRRIEAGNVQEFAWHSAGFRRVEDDFTSKSGGLLDEFGKFPDGDIVAGTNANISERARIGQCLC